MILQTKLSTSAVGCFIPARSAAKVSRPKQHTKNQNPYKEELAREGIIFEIMTQSRWDQLKGKAIGDGVQAAQSTESLLGFLPTRMAGATFSTLTS
jgi:hypothetical protein